MGNNDLDFVEINAVSNTGGANTFTAGVNEASVGDNAIDAGHNVVIGANTFGQNWAVVLSTATNPTSDSGNNTVGGIKIAIELPGVNDVGNCAASVCVNLFGMQLI